MTRSVTPAVELPAQLAGSDAPTDKHELPSLWQLRVFEAVARHENATQASHELLRSQPAVTSCLAELESMLGVTLFGRSTTGTYLTAAGVAALVRARRILQETEDAVAALGTNRKVSASTLVSGITRAQMRSLIAVEECGSFRAAARLLGVTDASLQRAARTLEQHLGCELYRRSASGVQATEVGRLFAQRLKIVHRQIAALVATLNAYEVPTKRCVTVGVLILDPTILIVNAINDLAKQFPETRIVVINGTYDDLLNKLLRDEIDFILGILKKPGSAFDFVEEPLYRERYCVVARRDHPLTLQHTLSVESLRGYPWVLPPRGSPRREAYETLFSEGSPPAASIETYSLSTIRIMLSDTEMLTVLSWTEVISERRFGLLAPLPVDVPLAGPIVGITTRREWQPNEVQAAFLQNLKRNAAVLAAESRPRDVDAPAS